MKDMAVRKLFTLLSACVNNDMPMTQIVLEKMSQSEEYQLLSSLDQFHFLTDQGRNLEKRMRDFKTFQPDNLANTYKMLNNLTSLTSEFKNVINESSIGAEEPIDRPYREVHILEKNYLKKRLDHDKRALEKSEVYCLWQDRNDYVYENDAAPQLKVEMDCFKCHTETQAEIRQSYFALEAFQNRFQQNRSGIISRQEYEQRENARIESERCQEEARIESERCQEEARIESEQKSKRKKRGIIILSIIIPVLLIIAFSRDYYNQINVYNKAIKAVNTGDYKTVESMIPKIRNKEKVQELSSKMQELYYNMVVSAVKIGDYGTAESMILKIENTTKSREILSNLTKSISVGIYHTVGLKRDGTVVSVGDNFGGQMNVGSWKDIVAVSAGRVHTVGLKRNGTVVAVGDNTHGQLNVESWKDIVAVSAGFTHTVGLKRDGTVVTTVGENQEQLLDVGIWKDIVAVSAGFGHTVGLKRDGTVVVVGDDQGQLDVGSWKDILAVSAGYNSIVGIKRDGTVVAVNPRNESQLQPKVGSWKDIVAVSVGNAIVGLKSDGTVVAVDSYANHDELNLESWKDIVAVSAGNNIMGLKSDGTVVAVGDNDRFALDVVNWKNIVVPPIKGVKK